MRSLSTWLIFVLLMCVTTSSVGAETLADLMTHFRYSTGEEDSTKSFFSSEALIYWLNKAQARVVKIGGYLPKSVDISYSDDSTSYGLPADFRFVNSSGVLVDYSGAWGAWYSVRPNPGLMSDTMSFGYHVGWKVGDSARLYLSGNKWYEGVTIRVHYNGAAAEMTTGTDTCEVTQQEWRDLIVEEAMSYYEWARLNYEVSAVLFNRVRTDMGVVKSE